MCTGGQTGKVGCRGTRGAWPCGSSAIDPTVPGAAAAAEGSWCGGSHLEPGVASLEGWGYLEGHRQRCDAEKGWDEGGGTGAGGGSIFCGQPSGPGDADSNHGETQGSPERFEMLVVGGFSSLTSLGKNEAGPADVEGGSRCDVDRLRCFEEAQDMLHHGICWGEPLGWFLSSRDVHSAFRGHTGSHGGAEPLGLVEDCAGLGASKLQRWCAGAVLVQCNS